MNLLEWEITCFQSIHSGNKDSFYPRAKLHRAFRGAGNKFLTETGLDHRLDEFTLAEDEYALDIRATFPHFHHALLWDEVTTGPDDDDPFADITPVAFRDFKRASREGGASGGLPELVHWAKPGVAWFYPTASRDTTILLPWSEPMPNFIEGIRGAYSATTTYMTHDVVTSGGVLYRSIANSRLLNEAPPSAGNWEVISTTWASGGAYYPGQIVKGDGDPDSLFYQCDLQHTAATGNEPGTDGGELYWTQVLTEPSQVTFNIPRFWMDELTWCGVRGWLLRGLDGHPEAATAFQEFLAFIEKVKSKVVPPSVSMQQPAAI